MNAHPSPERRGLAGRPILTVTIVVAALIGAGLGGVALANRDDDPGKPLWRAPAPPRHPPPRRARPPPSRRRAPPPPGRSRCPPPATSSWAAHPTSSRRNGGEGFFDAVKDVARGRPGDGQPGAAAHRGHRHLQVPPGRPAGRPGRDTDGDRGEELLRVPGAAVVRRSTSSDAGFELLNTANNHARDYGAAGLPQHPAGAGEAGTAAHRLHRRDHRRRREGRQGGGGRLLVVRGGEQPDQPVPGAPGRGGGGRAGPTSSWCRCTWVPRAPTRGT